MTMGMIGLDRRSTLMGAKPRVLETSLNLKRTSFAKTTLAKAKSILSPFTASDFAPVYA